MTTRSPDQGPPYLGIGIGEDSMAITPTADSQVLFVDNFSAPLDSNVWDYNQFSAVNNPSFYGRTQIRQSLPSVSGGSVHLALDTFNPTGFSLYGSEIITRRAAAGSHSKPRLVS